MIAHPTTQQLKKIRRPLPRFSIIMIGVIAISGCDSVERVSTATVLANANCKGVTTGLAEVSLAEVAGFRGSKLVVPNSNATDKMPETLPGSAALPLLVSMSRGPQLSRGFELHLADQAEVVSPTALKIDVFWTEPDTSKAQPLVSTTPCLVISVPQGPWTTIEAIDQNGALLGELSRTPTPRAP